METTRSDQEHPEAGRGSQERSGAARSSRETARGSRPIRISARAPLLGVFQKTLRDVLKNVHPFEAKAQKTYLVISKYK